MSYEVRISDWRSDVCSSDLKPVRMAQASWNLTRLQEERNILLKFCISLMIALERIDDRCRKLLFLHLDNLLLKLGNARIILRLLLLLLLCLRLPLLIALRHCLDDALRPFHQIDRRTTRSARAALT